jgi:lipopolysaccharide/colanic/teichoic acid biosynthesis glycosyltransferase
MARPMTIEQRAARIVASRAKRALDIAFALAGLVVTSPVWVAAAVAILLDDGRPIWYRQSRSGLRGREFRITKLRSMVVDADRAGARQAAPGDHRITRVGRWMRATAIDEVPQLWNILVGDMSVVGPRALRPGEIETEGPGDYVRLEDVPGFGTRSLVRPGLTGIAQIYAARRLPRHLKFRYDRLYITRQSVLVDVRLILQSIWVSVTGDWERRGRDARRNHTQ